MGERELKKFKIEEKVECEILKYRWSIVWRKNINLR